MANRISLSARDARSTYVSVFFGGMRARARDVTNHRVFFFSAQPNTFSQAATEQVC